MTTPSTVLEQALDTYGDTLYRVALLLGGDERHAELILRDLAADLVATFPSGPADETDLIARLTRAAVSRESSPGARRSVPRPPLSLPPLYRSLLGLPLEQRLALGLHLLLGYDIARLARAVAIDEPAARANLLAAVSAIAPAAGISLTDRVSSDHCPSVRDALIDPAGRARHSAAVRGHLASCALCRSFEQSWIAICQTVEVALRSALRDRMLPASLAGKLATVGRPGRRLSDPALWRLSRYTLPPLAVVLLIAALVIPGFTRRSVTVVDRETNVAANPQSLIEQALQIHTRPPEHGPTVWHARVETFWYFNDTTLAPLSAELWLDRDNPARHRLQLSHTGGGAPYELQIGNGRDLLYYALDPSYAPVLYGSLRTRGAEEPVLLSETLDAAAQEQALIERMGFGVWNIPPFYLRQAQTATDLRLLGRQRDGEHIVQIVSFSGISPVGRPADAPGATAERVTILLALDSEDGRLRSATELAGPAGSAQTSRVTWRLVEEEWINNGPSADTAFAADTAWNGIGEFPANARYQSADLAVPLVSVRSVSDPSRIFSDSIRSVWLPATAPPGIERALLLWPAGNVRGENGPQGLIYLGPDRRLIIRFDTFSQPREAENVQVGNWEVLMQPGHARSYRISLVHSQAADNARQVRMLIEAYGFTRADLLSVIESIKPLDQATLAGQDGFFR